jgi:hypothetical protein
MLPPDEANLDDYSTCRVVRYLKLSHGSPAELTASFIGVKLMIERMYQDYYNITPSSLKAMESPSCTLLKYDGLLPVDLESCALLKSRDTPSCAGSSICSGGGSDSRGGNVMYPFIPSIETKETPSFSSDNDVDKKKEMIVRLTCFDDSMMVKTIALIRSRMPHNAKVCIYYFYSCTYFVSQLSIYQISNPRTLFFFPAK